MTRAQVEMMLDEIGWPWDRGLSLLLDEAVAAEEQPA
jgi:hypothetical protein